MSARFRPEDGSNAASAVLAELARLWDQATRRMTDSGDQPLTQKLLAERSGVPVTTVSDWATGKSLPRDLGQLSKIGAELARWAGEKQPTGRKWSQLLQADQRIRLPSTSGEHGIGQPIAKLNDPFMLGVHQPVVVDSDAADLPVLPPYVKRDHDVELARVIDRVAGGQSATAVLVGEPSTGKTRACWEAVHLLPPGWRLWHPFDPSPAGALLTDLPQVGPRTVVWLNNAEVYLNSPGESDNGERVAASLRTLLTDSGRAPVLVLGTLWRRHWDVLTRGTMHSQASALLKAGADIRVPEAFTQSMVKDLRQRGVDLRLVTAAMETEDGKVVQYLAGVPELLKCYQHGPLEARAIIYAAMDARRMGHRFALPKALLELAAQAYMSDIELDALDRDWLEQALAYTAEPQKGVPGPLTPMRLRPYHRDSRREDYGKSGIGSLTGTENGIPYRLAGYLDQRGWRDRKEQVPPIGFWFAASEQAHPDDWAVLGEAAHARGLLQDGAQLLKNAANRGDSRAGLDLVRILHRLNPADHRPMQWVVTHIAVNNPADMADLLGVLRDAGADQQMAMLLDRDPAAHVALDNPNRILDLLRALQKADSRGQAITLMKRAAAYIALESTVDVVNLLQALEEAGADQQVAMLLDRDPAAHVALDKPDIVAKLLAALEKARAHEQVTILSGRAATHASLDDPFAVTDLLAGLWSAGMNGHAEVLANRIVASVGFEDPTAVIWLLNSLQRKGMERQAAALVCRITTHAAHLPFDDLRSVPWLLAVLQREGEDRQASILMDRDPNAYALSNAALVALTIASLWNAGAARQAEALAYRAAAQVPLGNPHNVVSLLHVLQGIEAHRQAAILLDRDPATHAALDDPRGVALLLDALREARANYQAGTLAHRAAAQAPVDDPACAADMVEILSRAGADSQAMTLAERAATHADLDDPENVALLLNALKEAGADRQIAILLDRDPAAHTAIDILDGVAFLLRALKEISADDQVKILASRVSAHTPVTEPFNDVVRLIDSMKRVGVDHQAAALAERLPAAGGFAPFQKHLKSRFRYGREPDGRPSEKWTWDDLS